MLCFHTYTCGILLTFSISIYYICKAFVKIAGTQIISSLPHDSICIFELLTFAIQQWLEIRRQNSASFWHFLERILVNLNY